MDRGRLSRAWQASLRFAASVMMVSGVLLIADAGATLLWQEPVSAFVAQRNQTQLEDALANPPQRVVERMPLPGDAIARIEIPSIGVSEYVVEGTDTDDLRKGPGHYPDTPLPGGPGTAAIAGHRTTSGAPFSNLDELAPGDDVEVTLANGEQYVFVVTGSEVVTPSDYHVISNSDPTRATLTLVTCTPEWTSTHRLIVYADLDPARSGVVGEPIITGTSEEAEIDVPDTAAPAPATTAPTPTSVPGSTPATVPGSTVATVATVATTAAPVPTPTAAPADHDDTDAFSEGWFADSAAWPQIALWGAILAAFVTGGWWLARFFKREWVGVLAAFVPFTVALYFFFQNVNRLLPAGL